MKFSDDSILGQIGNTPLLKLRKITKDVKDVQVFVKAEWFNPGGSVKDRPALRMIQEGEKSGELTKGKIILDSTSGNTGIAYAMIGAIKGYRVELAVPSNISEERKKMLQAFGAKMIFTDPLKGSDGAIREAHRVYAMDPVKYFMPDQYNNPDNWKAHYETTGVEIIQQTKGKITHLVAGAGTGGTVMGTGSRLKEYDSAIKVIGVEPQEALHGLEGLKYMSTSIVPGIYDEAFLDGKIAVRTEDAYEMVRRLAEEEGLLVGYSSGAAMKAALELAGGMDYGIIVAIFPDSGGRYLSTSFWEIYNEQVKAEEVGKYDHKNR